MSPLLAGLLLTLCPAGAADLTLGGGGAWLETISSADLESGPGSDLVDSRTSLADQASLDVWNTGGATWQVVVSRTDAHWPTGARLWARRTSAGTGCDPVSGGEAFQEVFALDQVLFSGTDDCLGITVQLRLTGLSLDIAPDAYLTAVAYRVE